MRFAPDVLAQDIAVHDGHHQVDHGHVEPLLLEEAERDVTRGTRDDVDPRSPEVKAQDLEIIFVVVHSQDSHGSFPERALYQDAWCRERRPQAGAAEDSARIAMPDDETSRSSERASGAEGESPALDDEAIELLRRDLAAWRAGPVASCVAQSSAETLPLLDLERPRRPDLVTPADVPVDYSSDLGLPGEYPFTRGVQPTMYRSRLWTMRMFAGFGTPEQTNQRFKYLLSQGQTGLSTAFDFPTLMGYDSDSPRSLGEVGMCGVAVDTLRDMEILFDGIPLDKVTTSMTINGPAIVLLCFYIALADMRGISRALRRRHGAERLPEGVHRAARVARAAAAGDAHRHRHDRVLQPRGAALEHGLDQRLPHPRSRRDGGPGARVHARRRHRLRGELPRARARRRRVSRRGSASSSTCTTTSSRRSPSSARRAGSGRASMKERFGAKKAESMKLRTHAQTAGVSLTAQQPYNNVVRVALQALAAVLGGTQSLHTNSLDETYALPTEEAVTIALRTQQIIWPKRASRTPSIRSAAATSSSG